MPVSTLENLDLCQKMESKDMWIYRSAKTLNVKPRRAEGRNLVMALAAFLALSTLAPDSIATTGSSVRNFEPTQTEQGSATPRFRKLRAVVQPERSVMLGVPLDGVLDTIEVREGDEVRAGQIVARMDSQIAEADLALARIEAERSGPIKRAESALKAANRRLEQIRGVFEQQGASTNEQLEAEETVERLEAELLMANEIQAVAQARFEAELAELEGHYVRAPFAGMVTGIESEVGSSLRQGQPIIYLMAPEVLKAELHLPLEYYERLEIGGTYLFDADQPVNGELNAELIFVDVTVNSASETFRCIFRIDNQSRTLPAGFAVELQTGTNGTELVMVGDQVGGRE